MFKLEYACVNYNGQRALVLACADVPGNPAYQECMLALEGGQVFRQVIPRARLNAAITRQQVTLVEVSRGSDIGVPVIGNGKVA